MNEMKVLYVEDDIRDADLTRRGLARIAPHLHLEVESTLANARARLATGARFDAVLTDVNLPDGSGLELVAEIRRRNLPIAVAVITGVDAGNAAVAALKSGADDFIVKHEEYVERLPALLEAALARHRAEAARRKGVLRVLYVEDQAEEFERVREHLAQTAPHIRMEAVPALAQALQRLPQGAGEPAAFDVLLLSARLAGTNAIEVLKLLHEERGLDLPVVLFGEQDNGEVAAQALRFGAAHYLVRQFGYLYQLPAVLDSAHDRVLLARERRALQASEQQLKALNESLEARVGERTAALADALELNRQILAAASIGIAAYRADGRCIFANEAIAKAVGGTVEEAAARNFHEYPSWKAAGLLPRALDALATGKTWRGEFFMESIFGRRFWAAMTFARFMRAGEPHLLTLLEDITVQKNAETALLSAKEEAERSSRAKTEFLGRMSHELRTPLNAILGFAQVLEMERLKANQAEFVREINDAGEYLLELINELLDLSRIEEGRLATVMQAVSVAQVVRQAARMIHPLLQGHNVSLVNNVPPEHAYAVLADGTRLRQVLVNLLANAVKYNRSGGMVALGCETSPNGVLRITVTDTGAGIPPEKIERLFHPFDRLGAEFSAVEGTGIGLALSKRLIELMGGSIGVDTVAGKGSTFWIDLRRTEQAVALEELPEAVPAAREASSGGRRKVLYVEDNAANLRLVEALFRHRPDLTLVSAMNGEYGLELAMQYRPDVILLDIHLQGLDGYGVLKALRARQETRDIPVIAVSADAMPIDIERGLQAGFDHYLTKPIKARELTDVITAYLDRSGANAPESDLPPTAPGRTPAGTRVPKRR